jgi:hypothetical protein
MSIKRLVIRSRSAILALFLAGISSWALPSGGFAARTNDAGTAQNAAIFINKPSLLLNDPNGPLAAAEITSAVRDFVAPQTPAAVIAPPRGGGLSADRQKAIGAGLGLAADVCNRPDPTFAAEIQTQIAGIESADAKTAYATVNGIVGSIGATLSTSTNTVTINTVICVVSKTC